MGEENLGVIKRKLPEMPGVVIATTIIAGTWLFLSILGSIQQNGLQADKLGGVGVQAILAIAVIIGLVRGNALAWQWGRIFPVLGLIGVLAALSEPNVMVFVLAASLVAIPILLSLPAAKQFYGIQCPKCSSYRVAAASFLFEKRRCKQCGVRWSYE